MALPIRTTLEDIQEICAYFATKPTGATLKEAKAVVDPKRLASGKISALKFWGLLEEQDDHLKATPAGRDCAKTEASRIAVLTEIIRKTPPYAAIIERAAHRHEDSLTATDVAAHWHDHFRNQVGNTDRTINAQAVCFFQVASGAGLGTLIVGRKGAPTRFSFSVEALGKFITGMTGDVAVTGSEIPPVHEEPSEEEPEPKTPPALSAREEEMPTGLAQGIFIAHGKNKKPLEQLKKILDQFKIPYKVATDEPNLGRPISGKVRQVMKSCNCAILIFTADEEFRTKEGKDIWRPSENVVYELGATGYLYDNRIVIMKEESVDFPSNFRDIGYISFERDQLEAKTMDILKELIGFGIVKVST